MDNFYNETIKYYSRINFPKQYIDVCRLDGPIAWYFADATKQFVAVNGVPDDRILLEIDIKSAFPTICNSLLKPIYPAFVDKMNQITDKKERNIFIATQLKETPYLKQLNLLCKLIILGFIFSCQDTTNILLLELKKDGCVVLVNNDVYDDFLYNNDNHFRKFIANAGFKFEFTQYLKYMRCNRTSIFFHMDTTNEYELVLKGAYKYMPPYLEQINKQILSNQNINTEELDRIYNSDYLNIIKQNNLVELLNSYYVCYNNMVLNYKNKYESFKRTTIINPRQYLEIFTFPVLLSEKLE